MDEWHTQYVAKHLKSHIKNSQIKVGPVDMFWFLVLYSPLTSYSISKSMLTS